jgi:translation initiation factor 1 (eIF-1/SUI1)
VVIEGDCDLRRERHQVRTGTGGTVTENHIEVQGDRRRRITELSRERGFAIDS